MYIDRTDDARPIVGKASKAIALPIRSLDLFAQLILFGRSILDYREKDFPSTALVGWVEPTANPKLLHRLKHIKRERIGKFSAPWTNWVLNGNTRGLCHCVDRHIAIIHNF